MPNIYDMNLTESYFPAHDEDTVQDTTVGGILRDAAAKTPDKVALIEGTEAGTMARRWTYAELLADAEKLAHALCTRYDQGERIAVWCPNTPEWIITEFAAGLAGLTLVTVNPSYQANELKYVLEQSRSVGLFLVRDFRGNPMWQIANGVVDDIPAIREMVDMDDPESLYAKGERARPLPDVTPEDPVQIQYTSGTTGFPKGAVLHHRGLTNNGRLTFARMGLTSDDVYLNPMPMFHTSGCGIATLGCTQLGACQILLKLFTPENALNLIEEGRVTSCLGVPTMLVGMLETQKMAPRDVRTVKLFVSGGSMVPPEIIKQVTATFDCGFEIVYGQTETSPVITQTRTNDAFEDNTETVGQPLPCTEISIRHPETHAVMPVGEVGEICSRGYCNMLEYNDNPEATEKTIDKDGWLYTGDLGTMDSRGYVKVTGRVKEMIIRGGENLFPAEIENVMLEHPQIAEVAVVGIPDDKWGEQVACFVRTAGDKPSIMDMVNHCRQSLSPQKTPHYWIYVDDWPLTGSGKIQKFKLQEQFVDGKFDAQTR